MKKVLNVFSNKKITWKNVIFLALIFGIYTGLIMLVPFLKDTSFQDIGISYEVWVVLAVIVAINSKNGIDSMFKCFVFFLISQPLVYLVEILFGQISFDMGFYYYKTIWLPMTLLTLPGGFIAYYANKQNLLGSIVLGLGNTILIFMGFCYSINTIFIFPYHLLSALFSFISIYFLSNFIQKNNKYKIISLILPIILLLIGIIIVKSLKLYFVSNIF